ncbi:MAG: transferrin-binding protein-like solute binding protein, partial [Campylobacterales bacterium]|nr:transferrin-binding protein-like solute binding protein [Campylobacterales bacterium]
DEDSINPLVFEIFAEDIDGDELELSISLEDPSVGSIELNEDTKIVSFLPASNYYGEVKLIVTVSDGKDRISREIFITVNNIPEPISNPPSIPSELEPIASVDVEEFMDQSSIPEILGEITAKIMNDSSDTYMEFGYITEIDGVTLDAYIPYIAGSITPSEVIEGYISNSQVGSYTGSVSALVDGEISSGTVSLSVDFGNQQVTGSLSADTWNATLQNGTLDLNGIRSDLSGVIGNQDATGSLDGKFYGPTARSVGGSFELNSATRSAKGVYGASVTTAP